MQSVYKIDKKTLRHLSDDELPVLQEYTGEETQQLRKRQKLSQTMKPFGYRILGLSDNAHQLLVELIL